MALPFFYKEDLTNNALVLDEDTSKHVTGVLRMKVGESILMTDGKGTKATAVITDDHRKRCAVDIIQRDIEERKSGGVAIAISLVKNAARFEWFLEKTTEMGVSEIIPLLCQRTEKEKFREERLQHGKANQPCAAERRRDRRREPDEQWEQCRGHASH